VEYGIVGSGCRVPGAGFGSGFRVRFEVRRFQVRAECRGRLCPGGCARASGRRSDEPATECGTRTERTKEPNPEAGLRPGGLALFGVSSISSQNTVSIAERHASKDGVCNPLLFCPPSLPSHALPSEHAGCRRKRTVISCAPRRHRPAISREHVLSRFVDPPRYPTG